MSPDAQVVLDILRANPGVVEEIDHYILRWVVVPLRPTLNDLQRRWEICDLKTVQGMRVGFLSSDVEGVYRGALQMTSGRDWEELWGHLRIEDAAIELGVALGLRGWIVPPLPERFFTDRG